MGVANAIWPVRRASAPTMTMRLGRLLHWIAAPVALLFLVFGIGGAVDTATSGSSYVWACLLVSLLAAAAGRGLRYVLAGE